MKGSTLARMVAVLAALAFVIALPQVANSSTLFFWEAVAVQMLFATSVNLLFGYANIPSFGQAAFFGVGAYAAAMLSARGVSTPVVIIAATVASALVAVMAAAITQRITGVGFSMMTLAIAQAMYTVVFHSSALGGENGISGIERADIGPLSIASNHVFWYVLVGFVIAGLAAFRLVVISPFGYALQAIREDPKRAMFLGINVRLYRGIALVIAGAGGGLAGALFAYASQIVTPDVMYWTQSGNPIIMALIGGRASFFGPLLGAFVFTFVIQLLGHITPAFTLYVGIIFLLFLLLLPEGLVSLVDVARRRLGAGTRHRRRRS
jgi:branched-chain amino acid transport system permease protein